MKRELVRWWQKQQQRLRTSPLVTAWMGVNSSRDNLYEPLVYEARREEQDVSETADQGQSEQGHHGQDEVDRD
jgi:hypothetical protein